MTKGAQESARFGSKFWGKPAGGNRNLWTNWREQRKGEPKASLQFIQLQHFFCCKYDYLLRGVRIEAIEPPRYAGLHEGQQPPLTCHNPLMFKRLHVTQLISIKASSYTVHLQKDEMQQPYHSRILQKIFLPKRIVTAPTSYHLVFSRPAQHWRKY